MPTINSKTVVMKESFRVKISGAAKFMRLYTVRMKTVHRRGRGGRRDKEGGGVIV